jgi:hypothetical protein
MRSDSLFADELMQALQSCAALAVLISPNSDASKHVAREVTIADQMCKRIFPVRLVDYIPHKALCYFTRDTTYIEWYKDPQASLATIVAALNRLVDSSMRGDA